RFRRGLRHLGRRRLGLGLGSDRPRSRRRRSLLLLLLLGLVLGLRRDAGLRRLYRVRREQAVAGRIVVRLVGFLRASGERKRHRQNAHPSGRSKHPDYLLHKRHWELPLWHGTGWVIGRSMAGEQASLSFGTHGAQTGFRHARERAYFGVAC